MKEVFQLYCNNDKVDVLETENSMIKNLLGEYGISFNTFIIPTENIKTIKEFLFVYLLQDKISIIENNNYYYLGDSIDNIYEYFKKLYLDNVLSFEEIKIITEQLNSYGLIVNKESAICIEFDKIVDIIKKLNYIDEDNKYTIYRGDYIIY